MLVKLFEWLKKADALRLHVGSRINGLRNATAKQQE